MKLALIARTFALTLAVWSLAACAELNLSAQRFSDLWPEFGSSEGYWRGDHVAGAPKIVVRVSEQRAYFYKGRHLVGLSTVSTGKHGFDTPPGQYRVIEKDRDPSQASLAIISTAVATW